MLSQKFFIHDIATHIATPAITQTAISRLSNSVDSNSDIFVEFVKMSIW